MTVKCKKIILHVHHFVWTSLLFCFANFILGAILLGISIYDHETDKRHVSVKVIYDWRDLTEKLIYFSFCLLGLSMVSVLGVTKRKKKHILVGVLIVCAHIALFIVGVCYTNYSWELLDKLPIPEKEIFESTRDEIQTGVNRTGDPRWIPTWLDDIQNKSKHCCGVLTFRDWNEFWVTPIRGVKDTVPNSCCRKRRGKRCLTDLMNIPFPDTVADNIKVDSGCGRDINALISQIVNEIFKLILVITIFLGISILVFTSQYIAIFLIKRRKRKAIPDEPEFINEEQPWENLTFIEQNQQFQKKLAQRQGNSGKNEMLEGVGSEATTVNSANGNMYTYSTSTTPGGNPNIPKYSKDYTGIPNPTQNMSSEILSPQPDNFKTISGFNTRAEIQEFIPYRELDELKDDGIGEEGASVPIMVDESSQSNEDLTEDVAVYMYVQDDINSPPFQPTNNQGSIAGHRRQHHRQVRIQEINGPKHGHHHQHHN